MGKRSNLREMFEKQRNFQTRLGNESILYHIPFIKDQVLALQCELMEALQETPWKAWKKNQVLDVKKLQNEIIDVWHFLINISMASGLDEKSLFELFMKKNRINNKRQDEGY